MTDEQENARQQRLRAALRENLKRRKGQIRGRAAADSQAATAPGADPGAVDGPAGNRQAGVQDPDGQVANRQDGGDNRPEPPAPGQRPSRD